MSMVYEGILKQLKSLSNPEEVILYAIEGGRAASS